MSENSASVLFFVINPAAGGGLAGTLWPGIEQYLLSTGVPFRKHLTEQPREAIEVTRQALLSGTRHFISVGGDGTHHEVINGLFDEMNAVPSDVSLGFIPTGSGNDFLRFLDLPVDLDTSLKRLASPTTKRIDIGISLYHHHNIPRREFFASVAGTGITADVTKTANDHCKFLGRMCYVGAFFPNLLTFKNVETRITIDEQIFLRKSCMTVVANTAFFGGGMKIAPDACIDDGLFEVLLFREFSLLELLYNFPKVFKGTHVHHPKVEVYRGRTVKIEPDIPQNLLADGEIIGQTPVEFSCLPRVLSVHV